MERIELHAKSSSGDSYLVVFEKSENNVTVRCGCKAGIHQKLCKHKIALVAGDMSMLFDGGQSSDLARATNWIGETEFIQQVIKLNDLLAREEEVKRAVRKAKLEIGNAMAAGIEVVKQ